MLDTLLHADQHLFALLNGAWHHPWLDALMPLWRTKTTWIPLYIIVLGWLTKRYGWQTGWILLAVGLTVLMADQTSSGLLKPWVGRVRPCRALEEVRLLVHCGGGYSFTSSHACNHFAVVAILSGVLGRQVPKGILLLGLAWAGSIAYGQIYVGVHYPLDVVVGSVLGLCIGYGLAYLLRYWSPYQRLRSVK